MIPPDLIDTPKLSGLDDGQRRTILEKAQFAALARAPATPEAKALVEAVASRLEGLEGELEARQRQRGKAARLSAGRRDLSVDLDQPKPKTALGLVKALCPEGGLPFAERKMRQEVRRDPAAHPIDRPATRKM